MLHKEWLGCCNTGKKQLAGFWGNRDFEILQNINTQNGSCYCGLLKTRCENLSLELDGFCDEAPRGNG
jgi:hypothetical protein